MSAWALAGKNVVLRVVAIVVVVLLAFAARVLSSAAGELEVAEQLSARGDLEAAVVHYRRAARFYVPLAPYHVSALTELERIGNAAEREGKVDLALSAQRAVRGAILSARSFYVPERERLQRANQRIAALMASQPAPPIDAGKSREQLRAEHLALLEADPGPHVGFSLLVLLGFGLWLYGAFGFSQRAIDDDDRLVRKAALRWGALIAVGFGLFVLGLSLA